MQKETETEMPNWVYNRILFEGPEADIQTLIDRHIRIDEEGEKTLDFSTLIPMPAHVAEEEIFDWNVNNWGVQSEGIEFCEEARSKDSYAFIISTALTYPLPIFRALASNFPTLRSYIIGYNKGWDWAYLGYSAAGHHEGIVMPFFACVDFLMPLLEHLEFEEYTELVKDLRILHSSDRSEMALRRLNCILIMDTLEQRVMHAPYPGRPIVFIPKV